MTSLLVKAIIQFSTQHANAQRNGTDAPSVGRGVGMCIGLFCLLMLATLCVNHFFMRSAGTGVLARAALISALYERESMLQDAGTSARFQMKLTGRVLRVLECAGAINLTNRSRIQHPNGKLVNHISTDISRIDFAAGMFHMVWTAPSRSRKKVWQAPLFSCADELKFIVQFVVVVIILLVQIKASALVGIGMYSESPSGDGICS
jgi:hypothetical protein